MLQSLHLFPPNSFFSHSPLLHNPSLTFLYKPIKPHSLSSHLRSNSQRWAAMPDAQQPLESPSFTPPEDGPIELSPDAPPFSPPMTTLQLFRSLPASSSLGLLPSFPFGLFVAGLNELRNWSSGAKKTLKEEALDSLKAVRSISVEPKGPPSLAQALLGGITAGVIALILYKFTTTIEASLNRQTMSDLYSVRQITITIRTIINGLCYLATFVFGIKSVGLFLYAGQLALNSVVEGSKENDAKSEDGKQPSSQDPSSESPITMETSDTDQTS